MHLGSVNKIELNWNVTISAGHKTKRERPERRNGKTDHERGTFSRGIPRASSPVPSSFSIEEKCLRDFDINDDSTSSMNDGSVDWKYKQIPIKNAVMMLNEMFPPPSVSSTNFFLLIYLQFLIQCSDHFCWLPLGSSI